MSALEDSTPREQKNKKAEDRADDRRVRNPFLGMNRLGLQASASTSGSRGGIFSGGRSSGGSKQQMLSKRELRVPRFSKKRGYPRWRKTFKLVREEAKDMHDYDSDAASRQEKRKFNNFMFRLLIEAGEEDEQFFDIVDAETEKPGATHHFVFAALENFYRKGKITELVSALVSFLKYIGQGETEPIERLTAVDEKLSKTSKNGYRVDGFIQLVVYAGGLDTDDQEKIWRMVANLLNKNDTFPSLDDIRTEIQAIGAARAAARGKKKESMKAEDAGHEFGAAAVVKKKVKQQVQIKKDEGDKSETDAPLCYKCGYFGHMRFECTLSKEEIRKKMESDKKKLSAGVKEKEKETKEKKVEARHVTVCSDDSEFGESGASDSDDSYDPDELYF
uniref:CCHC-type domain-containing protein n=1 Tax=Chromera velia CCMP2878 TaxID=1169474 RepID=A0A0G4IBW2_9ALVE|eukprot:Cvel_12881.t1-p1 / transcript=Cvel_12881.t1 / gene=Cvel_12881 / organism=Chromera_velia_CCMP2878 / gene_product=hypothetical protein / transcript_product=hypothetical protein / location=Cvel_scaffold860:23350-24516(+) / protein_length=389 / sequence_SO=supercontig / SO=protein_coding / is_pseudo=false